MTRSLVATPLPNFSSSFSFFFTLTGFSCSWRRRALTAASSAASMLPRRTSPLRARASQANSAIQSITFRNIALAIIDLVGCIIEFALESITADRALGQNRSMPTRNPNRCSTPF